MSTDNITSVYARTVLVPVANPTTAWNLLRLGALLAEPDSGEVVALNVVLTESSGDEFAPAQDALEELVEKLALAGMPVRWLSVSAPSPARGILDAAREENADLIVLGYFGGETGPVLGPVVEAVARTSPADLVVYRGHADADTQRILLPTNGSHNSQAAARLGALLSEAYHVPITALYVQTGYTDTQWIGLAHIASTLGDLPNADAAEQKVMYAPSIAGGILEETTPETLTVLGFSEKTHFESWLYGDVPQRVLRHASGPVILTKDARSIRAPIRQRARLWISGFTPTLTPAEHRELRQRAFDMARPNINFFILVILSCLIASFGLLQSSAAVIIGAMLIAPLMAPLLAFSVGLVTGELRTTRNAAAAMTKGTLWAIVIAAGVGLLVPVAALTPEITMRTRPSLLDMLVALISGAAGAYATARRDVPAALAGVAIAAALMPPLCAVGIAAALGDWTAAGGALLLFATNIVSIALAGVVVFWWVGVRPARVAKDGERPWQQRLGVLILVVGLMALPLTLALVQITRQEVDKQAVQDTLQSAWGEADNRELVGVEIDYSYQDALRVIATVRTADTLTPGEVARVQALLDARLGRPTALDVVLMQVVRPPD